MAGRNTETGNEAWFEVAFGRFYAELYAHRDDSEAESLLRILERVLPEHGPVLDLACGAGRLLHSVRRVYPDAVGLDLSSDLLRIARGRDPEAPLVRADMRNLPFARACFSAVFSLFTSFGYFEDPEDDFGVLQDAVDRLREDGIYVLDFLGAPRVIRELVPRSVQSVEGRDVESTRSYDPGTQVLRKAVRISREGEIEFEYEERVRAYTPAQLDGLFERAGLEILARYGGYGGESFDEKLSARYVLVGRKGSE